MHERTFRSEGSAPLATIVGMGAVSPLGHGIDNFWQGLFAQPADPENAVIRGFADSDNAPSHAYAAPCALDTTPCSDASPGRFERMVSKAIDQALTSAGWSGDIAETATLGLIVGTAAGDTETAENLRLAGDATHFVDHHGYRVIDRLALLSPHTFTGPVMAVSNACAAGLYALTLAAEFIANDMADAMCVVGVDVLSRVTQAAFHRMNALDPERCRPFDAYRQGTVFGEGAVALLLVSPALAHRFSSRLCHVNAYGLSCDAYHPTSPRPDGAEVRAAIERATNRASRNSGQIRLILPHGTGTSANDLIEGRLLADLFDCASGNVVVLPIKAHIGHSAGASGVFAALAATMAIASGKTPAVRHIHAPDPTISVCFPETERPLDRAHTSALVNAYAFGGSNTSVVLGPVS